MRNAFKALGDETRRQIVQMLGKSPMSAGEIADKFNMTNATISHHLSVLKESGLVSDRKDGKYIFYELNTSVMDDLILFLYSLRKKDDKDGE